MSAVSVAAIVAAVVVVATIALIVAPRVEAIVAAIVAAVATQLKSKLTNPESVCVYKTSGMKIAHLTTRLPGYVNEDIEAVIIHLGKMKLVIKRTRQCRILTNLLNK